MRIARVAPVLLMVVSFAHGAQTAQAQTGLREGVKVRIAVPAAPRVTGVVQSVTPDSIILFTEPSGIRFGIARPSVQSMWVSQGRSASAGAKKGALWGVATFGGLGILTAIAMASETSLGEGDPGMIAAGFAAVAVAEGAIIGAIIGAFVKSERWKSVSLSPTVGTGANGLRLGLQVR